MQKIATTVFICASIAFGVFGILMVMTIPTEGGDSSGLNQVFARCLFAAGFLVLSSFALSVAGKYLSDKK